MRILTLAALLSFVAAGAVAQAPQVGTGEGEVRRIDAETNKITVAHGPIPELNMRAMTMVLQAPEAKMLDNLAVGDTVKFTVARTGGAFTIQALEVVKPPLAP